MPYEATTFDQSIEAVQKITKNDLLIQRSYDFNTYISNEEENARGFNFEYDFRLSNFISGNIKFGYKNRKKEIL